MGLGDSLGDDLLHDFHYFIHFDFHQSSNFLDFVTHFCGKSIFAFEVGGELDDLSTDNLDDLRSPGDSFLDSLTNDFVDLFNLDLQFLSGFFQSSADLLGEDFFADDFVCHKFVDFHMREEVFLDLLNDFMGLGDSLGDDLLHDFHYFIHFDFHQSSNFLDLVTHLCGKGIFTFEVGCELDDLSTDNLDDLRGLGDSLLDSLTDDFVDLFSLNLQLLSGFFQSSTDLIGEDFFADNLVCHKLINFHMREEVFLDLLNDFMGLGDSLGDDPLHDFHYFIHFDFHQSSNFLDF